MDSKNNNFGFLKNSSIYLTSSLFSFLIPLLILPIYTKYLSPSDFGIIVLFSMFGSFVAGFFSANLHFASYRFYFDDDNNEDQFRIINSTNFFTVIIIFVLLGFIIFNISERIGRFFFEKSIAKHLIQLSYLVGCLDYLYVYLTTLLMAQIKSIEYSIISVFRVLIGTLFSLYFIFFHSMTYLARINGILISQIFAVLILLFLTRKLFRFKISLYSFKKSFIFALPLIPNQLLGLVQGSFDKTMLANFVGKDSVGHYSFGERFSLILKMITDSVGKVWDPYFMEQISKNCKSVNEEIIKNFYKMAYFFMTIGLMIIFFSEEMIKLLTTEDFYPSMYITPIYIYIYLFSILGKIAMNQISYSKKTVYLIPATVVSVIVNIALNVFLIPKFGAVGAAAATAISALILNVIHLYSGMKLYYLPLNIKKLIVLYLLLIFFTTISYTIMGIEIGIIQKIFLKILVLLIFLGFGIFFKYINFKDFELIRIKIQKKIIYFFKNTKKIS